MVVLSAIGRFFKKIWDWIKQTAWIQPLLIVGIIFGVIFSIPPIVKGIKNANEKRNGAEYYYQKYQLSLDGGEESEAAKLTTAIEEKNKDAISGQDKFFIAFVNKSGNCDDLKDGFETLETHINNQYYQTEENKPFHLITIFTDDVTSDTTDEKSAFEQYLERQHEFFSLAGPRIETTAYYNKSGKLDADRVENFSLAEKDAFTNPIILLVESGLTPINVQIIN